MKALIKLEEAAQVALGLFAYLQLDHPGWWLAVLIFAPDLSMLGYIVNPRLGAITYNFFHHKAVAILAFMLGLLLASPWLQLTGVILFTHSSLDRLFGYGLKYPDAFHNTHLGLIGPAAKGRPAIRRPGP